MVHDRFDHLFFEPTSCEASYTLYRVALGWHARSAWGARGRRGGNLIAFDLRHGG
jgi:hypothetical protein